MYVAHHTFGVIIITHRPLYTVVDCHQPSFSGRPVAPRLEYCVTSRLHHRLCEFSGSRPTFCSACEVTCVIIGHFQLFSLLTYLLIT